MKTLVVGLGNPIRSDDGAGTWIAEHAERWKLSDVDVRTALQLSPDWAESFDGYDRVIFIDSSLLVHHWTLEPLKAGTATGASTHHMGPEILPELMKQLGIRVPEFLLLHIPAESFDLGRELSPRVHKEAEAALHYLKKFLTQKPCTNTVSAKA